MSDASVPRHGPLPWLPPVPARLAGDADWGGYLARRAHLVRTLAGQVRGSASGDQAWVSGLTLPDPLAADIAVWRAAHQVPDTDRRPTGPVRHWPAEARVRERLAAEVDAADAAGRQCAAVVVERLPELAGDPGLAQLGRRLAAAADRGWKTADLVATASARPCRTSTPPTP